MQIWLILKWVVHAVTDVLQKVKGQSSRRFKPAAPPSTWHPAQISLSHSASSSLSLSLSLSLSSWLLYLPQIFTVLLSIEMSEVPGEEQPTRESIDRELREM
jgi:hypothetical protein